MQNENPPEPAPPVVQLTVVDSDAPDFVAIPNVPRTEALIQLSRLLQQRIPGFIHLSLAERRSMTRAGTLDPEFLEEGITTICAAGDEDAKFLTHGYTCVDVREMDNRIRDQEALAREYRVLADGLASSALQMRHQLGKVVLTAYRLTGILVKDRDGAHRHLQPYYERMQRAYMKNRKTRRKTETP